MLLLTDCVSLCNRLVRVTHWQRLVTKNVTFNERTSYKEFCIRIKLKFSEEIDDRRKPPAFRIYTLPAGSDDIEDRQLVDDDTKFEKLRDILMDAFASHPVIYVWNYDDAPQPNCHQTSHKQSQIQEVSCRGIRPQQNIVKQGTTTLAYAVGTLEALDLA